MNEMSVLAPQRMEVSAPSAGGVAAHCKRLKMSDGVHVAIHETNRGVAADITCVFIHGLTEGSFVWGETLRESSYLTRVLTIDLRGHGESDWDPRRDYSLDRYTADVLDILREDGCAQYILLGHSLGGEIIARLMRAIPGAIKGAVLIDAGPFRNDEMAQSLRDHIIESYKTFDTVEDCTAYLRKMRPLAPIETIRNFAEMSLRAQDGAEHGGYHPKFDLAVVDILLDQGDVDWWWATLSNFPAPTQIVRGQYSGIVTNQLAGRMIAALPHGSIGQVLLAGHGVVVDNPKGFRQVVEPFLRKCIASQPARI